MDFSKSEPTTPSVPEVPAEVPEKAAENEAWLPPREDAAANTPAPEETPAAPYTAYTPPAQAVPPVPPVQPPYSSPAYSSRGAYSPPYNAAPPPGAAPGTGYGPYYTVPGYGAPPPPARGWMPPNAPYTTPGSPYSAPYGVPQPAPQSPPVPYTLPLSEREQPTYAGYPEPAAAEPAAPDTSVPVVSTISRPLSLEQFRRMKQTGAPWAVLLFLPFLALFFLLNLNVNYLSGEEESLFADSVMMVFSGLIPLFTVLCALLYQWHARRKLLNTYGCAITGKTASGRIDVYADRAVFLSANERTEIYFSAAVSFTETSDLLILYDGCHTICWRAQDVTAEQAGQLCETICAAIEPARRRMRQMFYPQLREPMAIPSVTGDDEVELTVEYTPAAGTRFSKTLSAAIWWALLFLPFLLLPGMAFAQLFPLTAMIDVDFLLYTGLTVSVCLLLFLLFTWLASLCLPRPKHLQLAFTRNGLSVTEEGATTFLHKSCITVQGAKKGLLLSSYAGDWFVPYAQVTDGDRLRQFFRL